MVRRGGLVDFVWFSYFSFLLIVILIFHFSNPDRNFLEKFRRRFAKLAEVLFPQLKGVLSNRAGRIKMEP